MKEGLYCEGENCLFDRELYGLGRYLIPTRVPIDSVYVLIYRSFKRDTKKGFHASSRLVTRHRSLFSFLTALVLRLVLGYR